MSDDKGILGIEALQRLSDTVLDNTDEAAHELVMEDVDAVSTILRQAADHDRRIKAEAWAEGRESARVLFSGPDTFPNPYREVPNE